MAERHITKSDTNFSAATTGMAPVATNEWREAAIKIEALFSLCSVQESWFHKRRVLNFEEIPGKGGYTFTRHGTGEEAYYEIRSFNDSNDPLSLTHFTFSTKDEILPQLAFPMEPRKDSANRVHRILDYYLAAAF